MTNGAFITMAKDGAARLFWLFADGSAKEYTGNGQSTEIDDFTVLYRQLRQEGYREVL